MARPTKLNSRLRDAILNNIRLGTPRESSCKACGITSRTLRNWLQRAKKGDKTYAGLVEDMEQAEMEAQRTLVMRVMAAGQADWRAAAWLLARKWPNDFGERIRVDSNEGGEVSPAEAAAQVRKEFGEHAARKDS